MSYQDGETEDTHTERRGEDPQDNGKPGESPVSTIESISLAKPTLEDVFVKYAQGATEQGKLRPGEV